MSPPPRHVAYRAKRYLTAVGVALADLVHEHGRSKTTWSLYVSGKREEIAGNPRAEIEATLRARDIEVPAWLWDKEGPDPIGAYPVAPRNDFTPEVMMEAQYLSDSARARFRLFADPFAPEALADAATGKPRLNSMYLSSAGRSALMRLTMTITRAGFTALYGVPGIGKSLLRDRALQDAGELIPGGLVTVTPANIARRTMTAHHIVAELIRQLTTSTDRPVPRTVNVRDALLAEVLTQRYQAGHRVVLVIDEAHELPVETLKDLKRLHEVRHGYLALLGIVLIGQTELRARMDAERNPILTEVALRCTTMELTPMTQPGEIRGYVANRLQLVGDARVEELFADSAIAELERRLAPHRQQIPLTVNNTAVAALNCAAARGDDLVTDEHVADAFTAGRDVLQRWGTT